MLGKSLLLGIVLFGISGPANAGAGCDDFGRCFEVQIKNSLPTAANFSISGGNCYEGQGGQYPLQPGQSAAIGIARRQGHGCNGSQGRFSVVINNDSSAAQGFQFDNSDHFGFDGTSNKYFSGINQAGNAPGGWAVYVWSANGTWDNAPLCDSGRCFPVFIKNSLPTAVTWKLIQGNCYQGSTPGQFSLQPGQSYQLSLARVQGHGCDGSQGEFGLQPIANLNEEVQWFNFTNDGQLATSNATYTYSGDLSRNNDANNAFVWNANSLSGSAVPVAGCDDKSRCFWINLANRSDSLKTFIITGLDVPVSCYQGATGSYAIPAGGQQKIGIARVQGHGCDGDNGFFLLKVNDSSGAGGSSGFKFTNNAELSFFNTNPTYDISLGSRSTTVDGWFWFDLVLNGPWQNPPLCREARCFQLFLSNALENPITWNLQPGNCYQGSTPGQFTVQPNSRYQIAIARVQGHGCDGKQGEFGLQPVNSLNGEVQSFNFTNDGSIDLTNGSKGYLSVLSKNPADKTFTYSIDENISHTPSVSASSVGDWTTADYTLFSSSTDGFWPNFYQSCFGFELYHNQHVVRLNNDSAGNAYFIVSQSREHNGYITLLKVDSSNVDKVTDTIKGDGGAVTGKAVWQEVYTGLENGAINPVGNWNHPGKMTYIDGIVAVAAQNWKPSAAVNYVCGNWYSSIGTSEDKVLFYDFRNVSKPVFIGAMTASELGITNNELATVELIYDPIASKYLLRAGGSNTYPVLSASVLSPSVANWSVVSGAPSFSGQHGLTFETITNNDKKLVYFDASRKDGTFTFVSYGYSTNPPYLNGGTQNQFAMPLPGANRDWDASSIYVSPVTRKTIVYTVKSLRETKDYQIYQAVQKK